MKRSPIYLNVQQRRLALKFIVDSLQRRDIEIIVVSVDRVHVHILARFPDHNPRKWLGIAKKESSHYMKQIGGAPDGGLWGTRSECVPIANRAHELRAAKYVFDHRKKGAAVYLLSSSAKAPRKDATSVRNTGNAHGACSVGFA